MENKDWKCEWCPATWHGKPKYCPECGSPHVAIQVTQRPEVGDSSQGASRPIEGGNLSDPTSGGTAGASASVDTHEVGPPSTSKVCADCGKPATTQHVFINAYFCDGCSEKRRAPAPTQTALQKAEERAEACEQMARDANRKIIEVWNNNDSLRACLEFVKSKLISLTIGTNEPAYVEVMHAVKQALSGAAPAAVQIKCGSCQAVSHFARGCSHLRVIGEVTRPGNKA